MKRSYQPRPTHGNLVWTLPDGTKRVELHNQPWGVLQKKRKEFISRGIKKESLRLTYAR